MHVASISNLKSVGSTTVSPHHHPPPSASSYATAEEEFTVIIFLLLRQIDLRRFSKLKENMSKLKTKKNQFFYSSKRRSVLTVCRLLCCVIRVNCDTVNLLSVDSAIDQPVQGPDDVASSLLVTSRLAPRPQQPTRHSDRRKRHCSLFCWTVSVPIVCFLDDVFYNSVVVVHL